MLTDSENMPATPRGNAVSYEDFIIDGDIDFDWPHLDEHAAAALCYTSGTTGNPKGALLQQSVDSIARVWGLHARRV
ncbi:MAG: hypothetical protein CM1200mP14_07200 [Gammaproteobacteria bacterium]|nr:MAG: hypothetical protein CM1200mP14_07200 [Gammaproteobacteria bacterium]